jgi:flavin-binding protein dodecin
MRDHPRTNGHETHVRHYDDDGRRAREWDRDRDDDRDDYRASRYDDEVTPFSRREAPRRLRGNTVASVWEVTAQSRTSFDDAIRYGIERARRTLRHIRGAWVQGQEVMIRDNEIYAYRVQLKITYVLDDT